MSKKWKVIRETLAQVGYTSIASAAAVTITSMDADGTLYYTDEDGSAVKVLYPSATPIVVNSDTTTITVTVPSIYLAGVSGYTTTAYVTNQDGLIVTPESTFSTDNRLIFSTGGTYGELLTAVGSGSTLLTVVHNDGATISGTTTITVGLVNSALVPLGGAYDTGGTGIINPIYTGTTYYFSTGLTYNNQQSRQVTTTNSVLRYTIGGGAATVLTTGYTPTVTGTTTLVVYDLNAIAYNVAYTGVSYALTITVENP